jgi:hypothetical protein
VRGGNSPKGAAVAGHLCFRRSAGLGIVFFSFFLSFFLLGLLVLRAPAVRCIVWLLY